MPSGVYKRTKPAWNKGIPRTEEAKEKQRKTCLTKYGVDHVSKVSEIKQKIKESHSSEEWKQSVRKTKMERYGSTTYNNMEKNQQTKEIRYGNAKYNNVSKMLDTKSKNKSFNTSSIEELFYKYLSNKYGANDIYRNYNKDTRYPFSCDFYIKSKDLFIELNIHPSHNFNPFNTSLSEHREKLRVLEEKAKTSAYYKNVIHVWTISDPLKIRTAIKNNLNYIMYYSIKEVKDVIEKDLLR